MSVILDADPEVYRLGYGSPHALENVREAAGRYGLDLRIEPGIRVGLIVSDSTVMIFTPVPLLIEAGSTTRDAKPNAIVLEGAPAATLAAAAGTGQGQMQDSREIGNRAMTPEHALALQNDLKVNPPQAFDVARAMRVFTSKVQFVELQIENYRFSARQMQLPPELFDIEDDELRERMSARVRITPEDIGSFQLQYQRPGEEKRTVRVDEKWLNRERARIERKYTFTVANFGRVILALQRDQFKAEIDAFKTLLVAYSNSVQSEIAIARKAFADRIIAEFLSRFVQRPPNEFTRWHGDPTEEKLALWIRERVEAAFDEAVHFKPPQVGTLFKNVAPESVRDPAFLDRLTDAMTRAGAPKRLIESLFKTADAAPAANIRKPAPSI